MNIYFLVEGTTEIQIYTSWIDIMLPFLNKVEYYRDATEDCYYLFSGNGIPHILDDMVHAMEDINDLNGVYNYLVVCLDTDDNQPEEIKEMCMNYLQERGVLLSAEVIIIPQKKCIETWLLGNRTVFSRNPQGVFIEHRNFYDVSSYDPELMDKPNDFTKSVAQYHVKYLKAMLNEKYLTYSKTQTDDVCTENYLNELRKRIENTDHMTTFKEWIDFCDKINMIHNKHVV